ncbi:MAG: hypothetical protein HC867_07605 [Bacteroidia bacterium]|nr:hypothetical protein [Bacteroidia bacterium]
MIPLPVLKKHILILLLNFCLGITVFPQATVADTTKPSTIAPIEDLEDFDLDLLFDEFASFLDSISKPHSYFLAGVSLGKGYYSSVNKSSVFLETSQKITYSPAAAYFHKSGLGITATGNVVNDGKNLNLYQVFLSPGFDYLKNRDLATGISYTKYFTKDSLPFYTTPLQNELYTYFTYRKWWIRPTVAISYGWGSRSDYMEREEYITDLRLRRTGVARVNTTESVKDFSLITSLRHDFYWLDVLAMMIIYDSHPRSTLQAGHKNSDSINPAIHM